MIVGDLDTGFYTGWGNSPLSLPAAPVFGMNAMLNPKRRRARAGWPTPRLLQAPWVPVGAGV